MLQIGNWIDCDYVVVFSDKVSISLTVNKSIPFICASCLTRTSLLDTLRESNFLMVAKSKWIIRYVTNW